MDHPSERMSPEVELRVDIALAAIVQAVHAAAPWLPADDPVMDIMAPGRVRTARDVAVARVVIARMAERAKTQ